MNSRSEPDTPDNAADQTVETIAVPEHSALQPADHEAFFGALDIPPNPTKKLRAAFTRHCETIVSR
jgi:uncharacterized protein (DUF1778 family)